MENTTDAKKDIKKAENIIIKRKQSEAKEIHMLLKKYKKLIGTYYKRATFKEPCMILMRRTGKAKFYENVTQGDFKFEHSDGKERIIWIDTRFLQTMEYGKDDFKFYLCHEDNSTPLPEQPIITSELMMIAHEKALQDIHNWQAKEIKARGEFWFKIGLGIAIIVGAIALLLMFKPDLIETLMGQKTVQTAVNTTINATQTIR